MVSTSEVRLTVLGSANTLERAAVLCVGCEVGESIHPPSWPKNQMKVLQKHGR